MCRFLPLSLVLASFVAFAQAGPPAVLERFSADLRGLDGRFEQRVFNADGALTEESSGRVALSAPRQFRWEYEQPFPQLIVADGDQVWVYDPDLEQVTVRKQSYEEQQSPLAALIDPAELQRQFRVETGVSGSGLDWVILHPKKAEDANFTECRLGFADGALARMEMIDALAQRTEIAFSGWSRNPAFAADTFHFTPPPGADVVGDVVDNAQVFPVRD